ncbi:hypothetical protein AAHE18_09G024800 [Arachis hypogaea]
MKCRWCHKKFQVGTHPRWTFSSGRVHVLLSAFAISYLFWRFLHVRDFSIESQIEDLQSINQVWSFYLIYFLSGDVIGRVFPANCCIDMKLFALHLIASLRKEWAL